MGSKEFEQVENQISVKISEKDRCNEIITNVDLKEIVHSDYVKESLTVVKADW